MFERREKRGNPELPPRRRVEGAEGSKATQIRHPTSFADVEEIIDRFKEKQNVIVYLNEVNEATATRVKDILSGAIYALGGGMVMLQKDMYMFAPDGINQK
ncbi:MAG TPA: cell division protein SepF [Candidatus Borkfalkia faecipullorum]|uniref:Cell division protein SepF n=1 Tax=Candidatus Borkfalkia faecipullorum TaxID=2838510 RepID=A0A9D1V913_9FIRM|nr:cell division protein SepF [Candidatus Borkfalkia faecipullorum]